MDYSKYQCLKVEMQDGITTVTMNRPDQLNMFDMTMHKEVEDLFVDLAEDDAINVVVLTGAGRAFSAGGDIKKSLALYGTDEGWKYITKLHHRAKRLVESILNCHKPTIAAINGDAIGVGATIALCCDMQVIADTARIGDTHVRVGITAGDGGPVIWPSLIGMNKAKEYLMSGTLIKGVDAEKMSLVNYSVPAD